MRSMIVTLLIMLWIALPGYAQDDLPITRDTTHTVELGDTLETIGALYDVSVACLIETNDLESVVIFIGDTLTVSVDCPAYDGATEVLFPRLDAPGLTGADGTYVIRQNDTLDGIAQRLDIAVQSLQRTNNIVDVRRLLPGTVIDIPEDAPPYGVFPADDDLLTGMGGGAGEVYVVQPQDTLETIGLTLDVSVQAIIQANNLPDPAVVQPGQSILIPTDAPAYGIFPPTELPDDLPGGEIVVVQPGDTLDGISAEFDVEVQCVADANLLERISEIRAGDVIVIPNDCPPYVGEAIPGRVQATGA